MSAIGAAAPLGASTAGATDRPARTGLRLVAFFGLATCASLRYAQLVVNPPTGRVIAAVAAATVACSLLTLSPRISRRPGLSTVIGALLVVSMLALGALLLGAPARLLQPGGWPALARHVHQGVAGLQDWLWPYRGAERWSRLVVLLLVPLALALAGALAFWPSNRLAGTGRYGGLAVLVAVYLAGAANTPVAAQLVQGLLLLALVAAWVLLPHVPEGDGIRSAAWLAASGAAAAALLPVISSAKPWIGYRESGEGGGGAAAFQWNLTFGPNPWRHSNITVATVGAATPRLLRVTSLDRFDGLRFIRSSEPAGLRSADLVDAWRGGGDDERAVVAVAGLRSPLLLGGDGVPTDVRWLGGKTPSVARSADGTLNASPTPANGAVYVVSSYAPQPRDSVLRADRRPYPRAYLPYAQFELPAPGASAFASADIAAEARSRPNASALVGPSAPGRTPAQEPGVAARIEASPYGPMYALARSLAAGAPSEYDVAQRIDAYLTDSGYGYDERVPLARYPLEAFLFEQHRGYCQQFAGAMTLMLRMDGIPARVGVGFKPVAYNAGDGTWTIRASDAHSWSEVFFAGIGWVPFDPTPSVAAPPILAASTAVSRSTVLGLAPARHTGTRGAHTAAGKTAASGAGSLLPALPLLAVLAAPLAAWLAGGLLLARLRLRRALTRDPAAATAEIHWTLSRLGRDAPGLTLAELGAQLDRESRPRTPAARRYLDQLADLRYREPAQPQPLSARDRAALRWALARASGLRARVLALVLMPPLLMRRVPVRSERPARVGALPRKGPRGATLARSALKTT